MVFHALQTYLKPVNRKSQQSWRKSQVLSHLVKKPKENAKQKLAKFLENASKKVAESPEEKKKEKEAEKKKKADAKRKKQAEKFAELEERSNILEAAEVEKEEVEIDEDVAELAAKDIKLATAVKPATITPPSGMRKAAPKLSDREKLKQELEAGKKEKPSVL